MMKRIFSLLLALVLVVSCLPVSAFAEEAEGEGSVITQDEAAKAAAEKAAAEKAAAEKAAAEKAAAEKAAAEKAAAEKAAAEKAAADEAAKKAAEEAAKKAAEEEAAKKAAEEAAKKAAEEEAAKKAAEEEAAKKAAEEEAAKKAAEEAAKKAAEEEAARKAAAEALNCTCDAKCTSVNENCPRCKEYHAYCGFTAVAEPEKTQEEDKQEEKPACDCSDKCTEANENCALCKADFASCTGMTAEEKAAAEKAAADKEKIASVQKLVDALPDTVTPENKDATGKQLNELIRAYGELEADLQAQVDLTRYDATIAAMYALEGMAGAQNPVAAELNFPTVTFRSENYVQYGTNPNLVSVSTHDLDSVGTADSSNAYVSQTGVGEETWFNMNKGSSWGTYCNYSGTVGPSVTAEVSLWFLGDGGNSNNVPSGWIKSAVHNSFYNKMAYTYTTSKTFYVKGYPYALPRLSFSPLEYKSSGTQSFQLDTTWTPADAVEKTTYANIEIAGIKGPDGTSVSYSSNGDTHTLGGNARDLAAGTYTVTLQCDGPASEWMSVNAAGSEGNGWYQTGSVWQTDVTLLIQKQPVKPVLTAKTDQYVYGNTLDFNQHASVTLTDKQGNSVGFTVTKPNWRITRDNSITVVDNGQYTIAETTNKIAPFAEITLTDAADVNYSLIAGFGDKSGKSAEHEGETHEVQKNKIRWSVKTGADLKKVYTGAGHTFEDQLIITDAFGKVCNAEIYKVQYKAQNSETLLDAVTDAGTYEIVVTSLKTMYDVENPAAASVVIDPAELKVEIADQEIPYGNPYNTAAFTVTGLVAGQTHNIVVDNPTNDKDVTASGKLTVKEAVKISAGENDVTANYHITVTEGTLTITKSEPAISYTGSLRAHVYDDQSPAAPGENELAIANAYFTDVAFSWKDGAAPTDVGEYTLIAAIAEGGNTSAASCEIPVKITARPVTIDVEDLELPFTGESQTNSAATAKVTDHGTDVAVSSQDGKYTAELGSGGKLSFGISSHSLTNVADGPAVMKAVDIVFQDGNENYAVTLNSGSFSLASNPVSIAVVADSAEKEYDGTPLTKAGAAINGAAGLSQTLDDMLVVVSVSGGITDVGTADNVAVVTISKGDKVLYKSNSDTLKANFSNVTITSGTLEVKNNTSAIAVTADNAEKEYDGTALTKASATVSIWGKTFAVTDGSNGTGKLSYSLSNGHTMTIVLKNTSTVTDPGELDNAIESVTIHRGDLDVTTFFSSLTVTDGKLKVHKSSAPITITAKSLKKYYDNEVLSDYVPDVSIGTAAGKIPAAAITLGTAVTEETVTTIPLSTGDKLVVTVEGEITAPGKADNSVKEYKILRGTEDITAFYTLKSEDGELEIVANPTPITITADSAQKVYDAKALTCGTATIAIGTVATPDGYVDAKPITVIKTEFKEGVNYFTLSTGHVVEAVVDSSCTITNVQRDASGKVIGKPNIVGYTTTNIPAGMTSADLFSGIKTENGELKILPYEIEVIVNRAVLTRLEPYYTVETAKQSPAAKNVSPEEAFKYITVTLKDADDETIKKLPDGQTIHYTVERETGFHAAGYISEAAGKYDITKLTVINDGNFDWNNYKFTYDLDAQYIIRLRFEDTFDDGGISDQVTNSLGSVIWGRYYATPVSLKELETLEAEGKDYVVPLAAEGNYLIGEVHYSRQNGHLMADVRLTGNPFQEKPVEASKGNVTVYNVMFMYKNYWPSLYDVDRLEWTRVNMLDKDADVTKTADEKTLLSGRPVKEYGKDTYIMFYDKQLRCYRMIVDLGEMPEGREKFWVFLSLDAVVSDKLLTNSFKQNINSDQYKLFRKFN